VRFRLASGAVAALGVALLTGVSGAAPLPYLRSVGASGGHVVAVFDSGDLAPLHVAVASSPRTSLGGGFVRANVRLREAIGNPGHIGAALVARTRHALPPGRYWVEVSARPVDVDCVPLKPCFERWSNVRPLVVPRRAG
jgi:hypothetical protein